MLPSELLVARQRSGKVFPKFVEITENNLELASSLIDIFKGYIGKKFGELAKIVDEIEEDSAFDHRLIRGLETLLLRRCEFELESVVNPFTARRAVFEEANKAGAVTTDESRNAVLAKVADNFSISVDDLERSLWADQEEEQVLRNFDSQAPEDLLKQYNLSLAQTMLFRASGMQVSLSGNYKEVFKRIKYFGLMYTAEKKDERFYVDIEGPLALLKMTEKYGVSLAKLLPSIIRTEDWDIHARVLWRDKKTLIFELDSSYKRLFPSDKVEEAYDSTVEEKFASKFNSLQTGWTLKREPEALIAGSSIMIPDFGFQKRGMKFYMEVVGFWTPEYLKKKLEKLSKVEEDLILAVDKALACSKFEEFGKVIYYTKEVSVKAVLDILRMHEKEETEKELKEIATREIDLGGRAVISLEDLSQEQDISIDAAKKYSESLEDYVLIGRELVSYKKMEEIREELKDKLGSKYSDVASFLEQEGISSTNQMLSHLGYAVTWQGLNPDSAVVVKKS
ncbi:MAG: DUF790 family protein [Candidatus Hydrothermarchaeales archaeon]